ncbi:MAG: hypothetical protein ABIR17_04420 [Pseudolysinimonas sp.]
MDTHSEVGDQVEDDEVVEAEVVDPELLKTELLEPELLEPELLDPELPPAPGSHRATGPFDVTGSAEDS